MLPGAETSSNSETPTNQGVTRPPVVCGLRLVGDVTPFLQLSLQVLEITVLEFWSFYRIRLVKEVSFV